MFVSVLFGFVFVLLAVLVVAIVLGSEPAERRRLPDWATFVGAGLALGAAAAVFGMSLRLALQERTHEADGAGDGESR